MLSLVRLLVILKSLNCVLIKTRRLVCIHFQIWQAHSNALLGQYIDLVDTFANLGPIVDFTVVDLERQGQVSLANACLEFTCSTINRAKL